MKQHITQEQATAIAAKYAEDGLYETNICNAAIQHYLCQQAKEFPELPAPQWLGDIRGYTVSQLQVYGAACAAHAREVALSEALVTYDDLKEMESKVDYWREKHADIGLKYDNLLQSFHIAETDAKLWKGAVEKARVDALEEASAKITPPEAMRRTDGRTYEIAKVLAEAIRKMKAGK